MVSSALVKFSSPVAKSSLIALGFALFIDAILTILAAIQYPYLIDYYNDDLYIASSRTISIVYTTLACAATLISISTALSCYKSNTNYVLIHAGLTGVFLPVTILIYFTTLSSRYKAGNYVDDYKQMIADYRIRSNVHKPPPPDQHHSEHQSQTIDLQQINHLDQQQQQPHQQLSHSGASVSESSSSSSSSSREMLSSFINLIDLVQTKFSCCGVESPKDWINQWEGFIPPTCCNNPHNGEMRPQWAAKFALNQSHQFRYCEESDSYNYGCLIALRESESSKYAWLSDLIIFMILLTIANTIVSLLLFGLNKTDIYSANDEDDRELSMVGVSSKPRPSIAMPTMTSMKHRPSVVVQTIGGQQLSSLASNQPEPINAARAQAVRFNISTTPRSSISGPSKFSAAARRGSSFI